MSATSRRAAITSPADDLDTWLARELHRDQRLPLDTLQTLLAHAREPDGPPLQEQLVTQRYLDAELVQTYVARFGASPVSASARRRRGPWREGGRLGAYRILSKLGAGGMGTVWLAEHVETGSRYAIKTITLEPGSEEAIRFQREGEAQAAVDAHPNVAKVHAMGQEAGRFYLVMDLASGGDLQQRLEALGELSLEEAVGVASSLARALEHVHAQGVLHRDLKPSNILFDERGTPRLVDFGLAKVAWGGSLTETGTLLGTPAYMAPEQAEGLRGTVGPWTDVYALGAVMFHMLTGRPPSLGKTVIEVLTKLLQERPPSPRSLRPEVSPELEAILLQALERDPKRRPSAGELATALESLGAPRGPPARVSPPLVLAGVAAGVLGAVGLFWAFGPRAPGLARAPNPTTSPTEPEPTTDPSPGPSPEDPSPPASPSPTDLEALAARLGVPLHDPELDALLGTEHGLGTDLLAMAKRDPHAAVEITQPLGEDAEAYLLIQCLREEAPHPEVLYLWSRLLERRGLEQEAREALLAAAEAEWHDALNQLASERFEAGDREAGREWLARAVEANPGHALRKATLCEMLLRGEGGPADPARALELIESELATSGWAPCLKGVAILSGWPVPESLRLDADGALQLLGQALEFYLASREDHGSDVRREREVPHLRQALILLAERLDGDALPGGSPQLASALAELHGQIELLEDTGRNLAPKLGRFHLESRYLLGVAAKRGLGEAFPLDLALARRSFEKARELGHPKAGAQLARLE